MTSEHIELRKAAEMALEAMDMDAEDADKISWERLAKIVAAGVALKEAMAQLDRKCEAGPSLQDLWDCWDAVHGGQEPVARVYRYGSNSNGEPWHGIHWFNAAIDAPDGTLLYLHPAPIPEGWQLVPKEPTENMIKLGAYAERYSGVYGIYKAMLAAAPKPE